MFPPIEAPSEDSFHNQVVSGGGRTDTNPDINLPLGRNVEIGDCKDLLLLIVKVVEGADAAVVCVILDAAADGSGQVITEFRRWREAHALLDVGPMPCPLQRRVESEVPTPD